MLSGLSQDVSGGGRSARSASIAARASPASVWKRPARSGVTSRTASTRVGEPVWPKRLSSSRTSSTRSLAVHVSIGAVPGAALVGHGLPDRDHRRQRQLERRLARVGLAYDPQPLLERRRIREVRNPEEGGHLRRHLPGLRVDGLPAAQNEVEAFLPQRERERARGAECVRDREDLVREEDRAVGADPERLAQGVLGLGRAHRHRDDLAACLLAQPHRRGDRGAVEGVEDERHALALEGLRLLVELDGGRLGNLLDEADDLHLCQPTRVHRPADTAH